MAKISINMKSGEIAEKEIIVGIDLGTTHSLVAFVNNGEAELVKDSSGKNTLVPSIVHFSISGEVLVGDQAKAMLLSHPERTIYSVKRLLGKAYKDIEDYKNLLTNW